MSNYTLPVKSLRPGDLLVSHGGDRREIRTVINEEGVYVVTVGVPGQDAATIVVGGSSTPVEFEPTRPMVLDLH